MAVLFIFFSKGKVEAQISDGIFGQNAHLTDTVGTNTTAGGHLDEFWDKYGANSAQNHIFDSKTKYMRYGGIGVENDCKIDGTVGAGTNLDKTIKDYIRKAIAMQDNGIVPMLTLPLKYGTGLPITTLSVSATKASLLVKGVNDGLTATANTHLGGYYAPVVYWIYSNEPEQGGSLNHNYDGTDAAQKIYTYIKSYHDSIMVAGKWNGAWGTPKFIGPELYNYDNYDHDPVGHTKVKRLIEQLTGHYNQVANTNTGEFDIRPYISVFSWHYYPFNDESVLTTGVPLPTRANVVKRLGVNNIVVKYNVTPTAYTTRLKDEIDSAKAWLNTGGYSIDVAITETNICNVNDTSGVNVTDDLLTGNGANSYIAGQFWAEMMSICMQENVKTLNFWSSIEGYSGNSYATDVGFLNSKPGRFGGLGGKKPSYWHFKMLAENFKGTFLPNLYSTNDTVYKAFAYKNTTANEIGVIVMNQKIQSPRGTDTTSKSFKINFNNGTPGSADMRFKFDGSASPILEYPCRITNETTVLLVFDITSGALKKRETYSLQDALRTEDTGTMTIIADSTHYAGYVDNVHSNIKIGTGTSISAGNYNKTFRATNTIQLNGPFTSTNGYTLCLKIDQTCP